MKSKLLFVLIAMLAMMLVACSNKDENNTESEVHIVEATLEVPETAEVNEEIELLTTVTYGEDKVADADEVVYEIWEEGKKDESIKIESTNNDDGSYSAITSFDHDGIFHVQVHVTARDMHTMPKYAITIGEGGHYENTEEDTDNELEDSEENEHSGH